MNELVKAIEKHHYLDYSSKWVLLLMMLADKNIFIQNDVKFFVASNSKRVARSILYKLRDNNIIGTRRSEQRQMNYFIIDTGLVVARAKYRADKEKLELVID
jgi:transcription initiation factor IIE alpha subunit